ncbi:unnamed protein product [Prorocentrum cordatum]|uniref:Uncharacterized protein n=1 Tax=Prorocentrum cordatum TaxID=2364126 RepID=A0ABN9RZG9_9DINO|nr:unnamed protein product [Polarella glacialis]
MPPVMPYVCTITGDASFYPPLAKKGRTERSVLVHRMIVAPENTIENILQIAIDEIPLESENLVTAIHKIAKIRRNKDSQVETVTDDPRWTRLMQEVVDSGAVFKLQMRPLSLLAWAVSSLRDRRLLPMIFAVATKRTGMGAVPQDLASMAWAVATSRARDQPALLLLDRLAKEAEPRLGEFVPQDMAMCAWAFAKVQARGEGRFLRMLADEALARSAELNGQNVSNIVWSLATVRELHEPLMASVALTRADDIRGFGPQEFSNIVWAFATLAQGVRDPVPPHGAVRRSTREGLRLPALGQHRVGLRQGVPP